MMWEMCFAGRNTPIPTRPLHKSRHGVCGPHGASAHLDDRATILSVDGVGAYERRSPLLFASSTTVFHSFRGRTRIQRGRGQGVHERWSWPTLAKPILTNFCVLVFWPIFLNPKSPNPKDPNPKPWEIGADPSGPYLSGPTCSGFCVIVVMVVVVVVGLDFPGPPSAGPHPPPDRPKCRFFFSLSPPPFRSFSLCGCLLVEFWLCF